METFALDHPRSYRWKASRARPRRRRDLKTVERAATDTTSVHHVVENTDETPDDDETVMDWLRTIDADALEDVVNDLLAEHAMTILDPDRSRIVIIDFVDNPYHGSYLTHPREVCSMKPRDGTTNCHRYCTAFVLDTKKPLTLAITPVVSDEDAADAVGRVLDRVEQLPFEVDAILADRGYYQERVIRRARATAPVVLPVIKRENGFSINSTHTPPTGPNMRCTGQRPRASVPARGLCLLPQRRPRRERRSRPWICGVRSDRSHAQTGRNPLSQTLSHRNQLPNLPRSESNHHYTRPADSVCTRRCGLSVAESLVGRALDGRRPARRGGRDLPTEFTFELGVAGSETI